MLIRLVGPVTILAGQEPKRITAVKRACVLAVLAARPGEPVSPADLIDRVWDGSAPDAVTSVLYSYITRLRADLKGVGVTIDRADGYGYVLGVDPDAVDVHRARDLAALAAATDPGPEALELWRRACTLTYGEPLAGLAGRWARDFRIAFSRERTGMLAGRYAAELDAGLHESVVDELAALVTADPLAEPLVGQLMLALYRCGRQAEALRWYEATRVRLRDRLGADPSPELRDLHQRILRQDGNLAPSANAVRTGIPAMLPTDIASFTGRERHLATLSELSGQDASTVVAGPAGAGKTALAVHWAQRNAEQFPDGQLYINLRGFDRGEAVRPRDALGRLLQALGGTGDDVPDDVDAAAELFRTRTNGRRMVVVLDNAGSAEQVRPLLPGPGCVTVITSRNRMPGLVALNDARVLNLDVLTRAESVLLVRRMLGDAAVDADPAAADALARLCGDLPLALRIAAANLAGRDIDSYVTTLERSDRLALLSVDGDPDATVTVALDQSYADLDDDARVLFTRLGATPGEDVAAELVTAVCALPTDRAQRALERLTTRHLVEEYKRGRYRMHDLVRLYAAARAAADLDDAAREAVTGAFSDWHDARAETLFDHPAFWRVLRRLGTPLNHHRFVARCESTLAYERISAIGNLGLRTVHQDHRRAEELLTEAADLAIANDVERLKDIHGVSLIRVCAALGRYTKAAHYLELLDDRTRPAAKQVRYQFVRTLLLQEQHRYAECLTQADRTLAQAEETGDRRHAAYVLMARSEALRRLGRPDDALTAIERSRQILAAEHRDLFDPDIELANVYAALGEPARASGVLAAAERARTRMPELYQASLHRTRAAIRLGLGDFEMAMSHAREAVDRHAAMAARVRQVDSLHLLADVHSASGRDTDAVHALAEAATVVASFEPGWGGRSSADLERILNGANSGFRDR